VRGFSWRPRFRADDEEPDFRWFLIFCIESRFTLVLPVFLLFTELGCGSPAAHSAFAFAIAQRKGRWRDAETSSSSISLLASKGHFSFPTGYRLLLCRNARRSAELLGANAIVRLHPGFKSARGFFFETLSKNVVEQ
jgi:hypothetical protein